MLAVCNRNMQKKDDTFVPRRPLRAPAELPRPQLRRVEIVHRAPQTSWIRDDSVKANNLLDGLALYLRNKDPV